MEYELHERILLYLYERRQKPGTHNLSEAFKEEDDDGVFESAVYLEKQGYIAALFPAGFSFISRDGSHSSHVSIQDTIDAKIKPAGIDFVNKDLLRKIKNDGVSMQDVILNIGSTVTGDQSLKSSSTATSSNAPGKKSWIREIVIGVSIIVIAALILWYIFGLPKAGA